MALKALLLRKKLDDAKKRLDALRAKDNEFQSRETELEKAIAEMPEDADEETRSAVEESVTQFEQDKDAHENAKADLNREIEGLEAELEAEEETPAADPVPAQEPVEDKRKDDKNMRIPETRARMFGATAQEREMFFAREDVKNYLAEVRKCIKEKRALTNVGLTIPEVMLGVQRPGHSRRWSYGGYGYDPRSGLDGLLRQPQRA